MVSLCVQTLLEIPDAEALLTALRAKGESGLIQVRTLQCSPRLCRQHTCRCCERAGSRNAALEKMLNELTQSVTGPETIDAAPQSDAESHSVTGKVDNRPWVWPCNLQSDVDDSYAGVKQDIERLRQEGRLYAVHNHDLREYVLYSR